MKRPILCSLLAALMPLSLAAQVDPAERLAAVLPADVAAQVLERIEEARSRAIPDQGIANLALEGAAKGRGSGEILAAVDALASGLGRAMSAFEAVGRAPAQGEVEAAAAAMRMGVDAEAIGGLARSQPSGRTLAVPMLVMGGLVERGLPSDEVLAMVVERLASGPGDADFLGAFPEVGQALGRGMAPNQVGPALAGGLPGFQVPVAGINVPVGPPSDIGGRPSNLPRPPRPAGPVGGPPIG
jgi:hypothetical protein